MTVSAETIHVLHVDDEPAVADSTARVKRIAEAHGWDVAVTEGVSGGAWFEITNVEYLNQ
ncbi:hypothetical protein BRC65_07950 [Halobacteriales archaeon QH_2_65_14]|nr:MAG: hypothetical protein BRC65_07950 [Halobacteriales archaeon QH_2_65_14]